VLKGTDVVYELNLCVVFASSSRTWRDMHWRQGLF